MDYRDKLILAPMVRVGTLPLRLLARRHGADIVYTEEIIDRKIIKTRRVENEKLGTIDFVLDGPASKKHKDGTQNVVFRTCPEESPCVFQLGTNDPVLALQAAQHVVRDVAAIDVNMGCPKSFSISGGMGAALLSKPDTVRDILTTLVRNIDKPVTCKIRLLDKMEDTIDFVKMIEQTGVAAIGVHARYIAQRPREKAHWGLLSQIASAVSVPIIANGDVFTRDDFDRLRMETGVTSAMMARGAMWNPSCFRKEGLLDQMKTSLDYLDLCAQYENHFPHTKYTLLHMFEKSSGTPLFEGLTRAKTHEAARAILEAEMAQPSRPTAVAASTITEQEEGAKEEEVSDEPEAKRRKIEGNSDDS